MGQLKYIPTIDSKYRDWTVISNEVFRKEGNRATYWKVRCKCGTEGLRNAAHLVNNRVSCCKSCAMLKLPFEKSYFNKVKFRANKMGIEFNITLNYILNLFDGKCKLSGESIKFGRHWDKDSNQTASLDRIDSTKGYIKGNVQWVHKDVNFMKRVLTQKRFLELCKKINNTHI